ncbi:ATP-binding protein [Sphingomonas sp. RP10(2022)]|uniref:ATP-binding protein n=1 Tax=Sphingomonas liriopis TaxID=2949094 RepID=A0A9X2KRJ0_9SPHN|nr:ATP-binding protein [Sphingomonas liriopis]MCP3735656.1 ATP-binding protein [Sphingomonas liriopis]
MSIFQKAVRKDIPLLIGVEGASGSGKTKSGLEILTGIGEAVAAREGRPARLGVIDTENKRALYYASSYDFLHLDMQPPFSPLAFGDLIDEAERAGIDALMIDSFSHEWAGEGGVKDWAERLEAGIPKAGIANPESWKRDHWIVQPVKSPGNWSEPKSAIKPGHKWLVAKMLRAPMHIVLCLRSEEKMLMRQVPKLNGQGEPEMWNGKPKMVSEVIAAADRPLLERWQPQCEKDLPYEISTSLLFLPTNPGVPVARKVNEEHVPLIPLDRRITRDVGRALAEWADGAKQVDPRRGEAIAAIAAAPTLDRLERLWAHRDMAPFQGELRAEYDARKADLTPDTDTQRDDAPQNQGEYDGV